MTSTHFAAAVVLLAASATASANSSISNFGTLSGSTSIASATGDSLYTFSLSQKSTVSLKMSGIPVLSAWLAYPDTSLASAVVATPGQTTFNFGAINKGDYFLLLYTGNYSGATYSGTLSVAAPVPEPENYAMLAVGLTGVGVAGAYRRRRG